MFLVLLEPEITIYPASEKLNKEYKKSSRLTLTKRNLFEIVNKIQKPPLLNLGWLIYVQDISKRSIKQLITCPENNLYVFKVTTKTSLDETISLFKEVNVKYKLIDNHKITKDQLVNYIKSNLNISTEDAKYLIKTCNGYQRNIINAVRTLKSFNTPTYIKNSKYLADIPGLKLTGDNVADYRLWQDYINKCIAAGVSNESISKMLSNNPKYSKQVKTNDAVNKQMINRYVPKSSNIPVYELANYLIGIDNSYSSKDMISLIYQYRYGFDSLLTTTKKLVNDYVEVFTYISSGELTIENYILEKQKLSNNVKIMSDFRLYKMIDSYNYISFDWLYFIGLKLNEVKSSNLGIYNMIALIKLCGGKKINV